MLRTGVAPRDAAGPPRVRRGAGGACRPPGAGGGRRRLRLRPGGDVRRGARDHDQPRRRVPGLRVVHGVAPGERDRDRGPREPALRVAPRPRRPAARRAGGGGRRRRGGGSARRAATEALRPRRHVAPRRLGRRRGGCRVRDEHRPRPAAGGAPGGDGGRGRADRAARAGPGPAGRVVVAGPRGVVAARAGRLAAGRGAHHAGAAADDPDAVAARRPDAVRGAAAPRPTRSSPRPRWTRPPGRPAFAPPTDSPPTTSGARCAPPRRASAPWRSGCRSRGTGRRPRPGSCGRPSAPTATTWPPRAAPAVTPRRRCSSRRRTTARSARRSCSSPAREAPAEPW